MGVAPLTIVQETIIVQFFHGNGLGFALAIGLTFGRLVSFKENIFFRLLIICKSEIHIM